MRGTIQAITSLTTNTAELGVAHYELRVRLIVGEVEETIDVTAEQLLDYRNFQEILLTKTGRFITFGLAETQTDHEAFKLWQKLLDQATWYHENDRAFEVRAVSDEEESIEEDDAMLIRLEE